MMGSKYLILSFISIGLTLAYDSNTCPYTPGTVTYYPHTTTCSSSYYECIEGTNYLLSCPGKLYWNDDLKECSHECSVSANQACPPTGTSYLPHYSNCSLFYECDEGIKELMFCPDYYAFDIVNNTCIPKELVDCSYTTLKPSTTPQPLDPSCPETGIKYYPDYANCTMYYQCDDGYKTLLECPAGQAWSIPLDACDFIEHVDCSYTTLYPPTTPGKDPRCPDTGIHLLPDLADCTSYWQCTRGYSVKIKCPDGYAYDTLLEVCDFKENVDCSYTTLNPPTTPANDCPATGTSVLPNYGDCSSFFKCVNGDKIPMQCRDGFAFDISQGTCDYAENVNCNYTTLRPNSTPTGPTQTQPISTQTPTVPTQTQPSSGPTTTIPTTTPIIETCPPDGISYLPDYGDCSSYYECNFGNKTLHHCDDGEAWNIIINACDGTENVDCSYTTTSTTAIPTTTPSYQCPPTGTSYIPNLYDCTKFYVCEEGEKIARTCPKHYSWNIERESCQNSDVVDCSYTRAPTTSTTPSTTESTTTTTEPTTTTTEPTTTTTTTTEPTTTTTEATTTTTEPTTTTTESTTTTTTEPTTTTTEPTTTTTEPTTTTTTTEPTTTTTEPTTTTTTEPTTTTTESTTTTTTEPTTTTTEATTTTTEATTTTTEPTTTGTTPDPYCPYPNKVTYHAHPYNCSLYYKCIDGERQLMECDTGYRWNNIVNTCDLADSVDCSYTSISTETAAMGGTKPYPGSRCSRVPSGTLLPHPSSCKKYIQCEEGQDIIRSCKSGTSWNKKIKYCDINNNNNCETLSDLYF